ncbi:class III extradiol ring-cleavage dioxygenase [Methylibium sp.]|uniref:dioxygenase family protein n=1 Tax=Methylibium sp. TaxID=2067992 RepID=UPI00286AB196|nr:class III extradiol ring-cleavage dioxygenase [Methylibium sp.]
MNNTPLPSLFVSHGSPMIAIEPSPTLDFLRRLGPAIDATFGRPRAVLVVSPHTATREPVLLAAKRHAAVHDFGGFPSALYELRYDAPGDPALAERALALLQAAGIAAHTSTDGGLDHGIWTVLRHLWPDADVPVLPLSLVPSASPAVQWALGEALAPLAAQGVLMLGSGSLTHDLRRFFGGVRAALDAPVAPDVVAFADWVAARVAAGDRQALLDYRRQAPHAVAQHPTDEHWLPFYVAAGAGGLAAPAVRLHDAVQHGALAMDAYAFGAGAERLAQALGSGRPLVQASVT